MKEKKNWQSKVEDYKQSGKSIAHWCREQNIPPSSFSYHLKRSENSWQTKFAELESPSSGIRLKWGKISLELEPGFDERTLCHLLKTMEKIC